MVDGIPVGKPEDGHAGAIVFEEHALQACAVALDRGATVLDRPDAVDRGRLAIIVVGGPIAESPCGGEYGHDCGGPKHHGSPRRFDVEQDGFREPPSVRPNDDDKADQDGNRGRQRAHPEQDVREDDVAHHRQQDEGTDQGGPWPGEQEAATDLDQCDDRAVEAGEIVPGQPEPADLAHRLRDLRVEHRELGAGQLCEAVGDHDHRRQPSRDPNAPAHFQPPTSVPRSPRPRRSSCSARPAWPPARASS